MCGMSFRDAAPGIGGEVGGRVSTRCLRTCYRGRAICGLGTGSRFWPRLAAGSARDTDQLCILPSAESLKTSFRLARAIRFDVLQTQVRKLQADLRKTQALTRSVQFLAPLDTHVRRA